MTDVTKMNIWMLLLYLVLYIVLHYLVIRMYNNKQHTLNTDLTNEKLIKQVNVLKILSKWFPAIYLVIVLLILI